VNRLEAWLLHISTVALTLTGLAYAWMRYMMKPQDPFSVVNHPLEPQMLSLHILAAPVLVVGLGLILHGHVLFKIASGSRTARKSGLVLIPTFVVMVLSGYLLQVITSEFRKTLVAVHLGSGSIWFLFYLGHQIASFAQRRLRMNGKSIRFPVQVLLFGLFLLLASCQVSAAPLEREVYSMGTTLRLVVFEDDHQKALRNSETLIRVIEETDNQLSTWKTNSEVSRLNAARIDRSVRVSESLFVLIEKIKKWAELTGGAFEPGIGKLVRMWGLRGEFRAGIGKLVRMWGLRGEFRVPTQAQISDALHSCGIQFLYLDSRNRTVTKSRNIWIDPGAFGKGEALDRAISVAVSEKMAPVLLDFGGQIAVHGSPTEDRGWITRIADPENRFKMEADPLVLKAGSLSTSGYSERSGEAGGKKINHILNPATGQPVPPFGSVTVWHEKALVADILSTALYVMGPESGYEWALKNNIAAAFVSHEKVMKTPEFNRVCVLNPFP
jgi:thiamine biosynthesis lipoprotein